MRRRAAVFVLLLGGVLAARPLLRETPDERRFVVTLDKAVQHLRLVWRDPSGDVLRQVELRFPRGAPASVERVLRLEPGRYELEIKTETGQSSTEVTRIIDVQPDTSEVRVQGP